jgi:nucleoside-diphosphate-sugar epimerase
MTNANNLILLGVGQVAKAVIAAARGTRKMTGTTRDPRKIFFFADMGVMPLIMPLPSAEILGSVCEGTDVLVSFPPDGETDRIFASACSTVRRIIYISSTGVYGKRDGTINDTTLPDDSDEGLPARIAAENTWKEAGAVILRVPGIYGPDSGLHLSLKNGKYRFPGNGERYTSRIHVDDLAAIILAMFAIPELKHQTYVTGDLTPCTQREIVSWLCEQLSLSMPESVPLEEVHRTLRGNRRVDPSRLLAELAIELKYPDYKQGYESLIANVHKDNETINVP